MPPVVVIAPGSFKGSLSAPLAAQAIAAGLRRVWPEGDLRECPLADGGEGTLEAILSRGGERRYAVVSGAGGEPVQAAYGLVDQGMAVIEVAQVVGITDANAIQTAVSHRSTLGVGELIAGLLDRGVREFLIGLGGSSTNDGGAGLLVGLGLRLMDAAGHELPPTPDGLSHLASIDASRLHLRLAQSRMTLMSDVSNPLCGETGATAVFGAQKGVAARDMAQVDATIGRFAAFAEDALGRGVAHLPGAGAAGGLGFALQLLGANSSSGAEAVAAAVGLDAALAGAHWLITGEGRSDAQTLFGKAPQVAAWHARQCGVPASLLSGGIDRAALPALAQYFAGCFSLTFEPMPLEVALRNGAALLADRAEQMARLWDVARLATNGPRTGGQTELSANHGRGSGD